jgi:hypothetical protein
MNFFVIIIVVTAALQLGCTPSHEPASGAAAATAAGDVQLRAAAGATIVAIDDKHVRSGDTMNTGSQTVPAPAGSHKIGVFTSGGNGSGEWTVPLMLEAGHIYRFEPASAKALSLRVIDETTGQQLVGPSASLARGISAPPQPRSPSARPSP